MLAAAMADVAEEELHVPAEFALEDIKLFPDLLVFNGGGHATSKRMIISAHMQR
jgi:hypothetical protein